MGIVGKDFEGHDMSTVRNETDKISKGFFGFTGKRRVVDRVENRLIPVKTKKGADVHHSAQ
jgi:hypothetical protein